MTVDIRDESYMSDADILDRIAIQETKITEALEDTIFGPLNPLIIKGPPGCGKSEGVRIAARQSSIESIDIIASIWQPPPKNELDDGRPRYPYDCVKLEKITGALFRASDYSKWALAADLYANRHGGIICIDDNDTFLRDMDSTSMIMQATEKNEVNAVTYAKANSTHELQLRGVEPKYESNAKIIILTNIDMAAEVKAYQNNKHKDKSNKNYGYLQRWAAMISRGCYIDMTITTPRSLRVYCEDKIKRTNMLTKSSYLEKQFGRSLTDIESNMVLRWIRENQQHLSTQLDLRTYIKVAEVLLGRPTTWERSAAARYLKMS